MVIAFIGTILAVGALLLLNEAWVRQRSAPSELSRKFIHITVGSFVAFWPFFLSWTEILILSGAFVLAITVSKYFHILQAIHSVQRPTYGEIFFGVAVGAVALVTHSKSIYAVSLLQMGLADGLAAVIGMRFGTGSRYKVLGATKSIAGSLTFFVVSVLLLVGLTQLSSITVGWPLLVGLAAAATALENLGVLGLDNLFVPLVIAVVLSR